MIFACERHRTHHQSCHFARLAALAACDDWAYVNPLYTNQFIDYFNNVDAEQKATMITQMYFWQKVFAGLEGNAT
jgi:hypothetical protein